MTTEPTPAELSTNDPETVDRITGRPTLDDIQKWRTCDADTPGPRQVSAVNKALRSLAFAGRGEKTLTGTIGGLIMESHAVGCVFTGERAACTITAEYAIGNAFGWFVTKKNAAKLRKAIDAATVAADETIPIIDERVTPEAAEERDASRLSDSQAQHSEYEARQAKARADHAKATAPILAKKPPGATAVILAQLDVSDSDSMTDYSAHHLTRVVAIGYRSGTRENFKALRVAAGTFEPTSHLGPDASSEVEHRDNHSMGGGNFVKDGGQHCSGWRVVSRDLTSEGGIPATYGDTIEDGIPEAATAAPVTGERFEILETANKRGPFVLVVPFGARVDRATFEAQRDAARAAGGWYSRKWGRTPGGFGFDAHKPALEFALSVFGDGDGDDAPPPVPPSDQRADEAQRLEFKADKLQAEIDHKRSDLTQNSTPRRERIKSGQRKDADHLEEVQKGLRAIACAMHGNTLPPILAGVKSRRAVSDLLVGAPFRSDDRRTLELVDLIKAGETEADRAAAVERTEADYLRGLEADVRQAPPPGFFPTPAPIVERMLEAAQIDGGGRYDFLEPSAGIGSIAEPLRDYVKLHGGGLVCVERSLLLCQVLAAKGLATDPGCTVAEADFLAPHPFGGVAHMLPDEAMFDRILMNPPFEERADVVHVQQALSFLAPGGVLVALVTPRGAATLLATHDEGLAGEFEIDVEQLPAGSFTGVESFRQTGVAVAMVTITRD